MWECPNCETINNSDFCIVCGQEMPPPVPDTPSVTPKAICRYCGQEMPANARYCTKCGMVTFGEINEKRSKNKYIITAIIVLLMMAFGLIAFLYYNVKIKTTEINPQYTVSYFAAVDCENNGEVHCAENDFSGNGIYDSLILY